MAKYRLEKISDILSWFRQPFKLQPLLVNIPFKKKKKKFQKVLIYLHGCWFNFLTSNGIWLTEIAPSRTCSSLIMGVALIFIFVIYLSLPATGANLIFFFYN